jgi:hypothetical protein
VGLAAGLPAICTACLWHFQLGFGSTSLAQIHQDTWDYCSIFWQMGFNPSPFAVLGCCTDFMDTGSWLGCSWFSLQGSGWQEDPWKVGFARLNFNSNLAKFDKDWRPIEMDQYPVRSADYRRNGRTSFKHGTHCKYGDK